MDLQVKKRDMNLPIDLNIKSVKVECSTRKLRAEWTSEMATDISGYSGIDWSEYFYSYLKATIRKEKIEKILSKI
jgi:hypothetical protein